MVGIVKSTHSKAQILKHFIMHLCSAYFKNIIFLVYRCRFRYCVQFSVFILDVLWILSLYVVSISLSLSLIHRAHFLNLPTELIRICCVLLFKSPGIDQIAAVLRSDRLSLRNTRRTPQPDTSPTPYSYTTRYAATITKLNSVALVRTRTIPTERPPPVGEVSANFCG